MTDQGGSALLLRGELAEAALDGRVPAQRYIDLLELQTITPAAWVRAGPELTADRLDQLLFGERFEVLDVVDGAAFGRAARDGCIGWVARAALGPPTRSTHRVSALRAFAYAEPDLGASAEGPLALNALVSAHTAHGRWLHDPAIGWLSESDLALIGQAFEADPAAVALRFLGAPYLRGARDGVGLDAPGLIQQAFYACGLACPRVLDKRCIPARALKQGERPARGDLVFWEHSVGLMLDGERLITADPVAGVVLQSPPAAFTIRRPRF